MTSPSATSVLIDGRYRLGELLGTGGAAVVRRARDERLGRDVAVKLFHPGTSDEQRQSGELALMATLAHPALVRMYDGGHTVDANGASSTYLVMELVPGPTLHRALDAGAMAPGRVAAIGRDLAAALAYLHTRGVVHRDVKPANVLMAPHDDDVTAKLGDFGVARMLDGTRVTATGMTVGTANYLSPEQVRGEAVGPPSDVYSLGLVLLEALTGRIAYDGVGVAAALARLNRQPEIPDALGAAWCGLLRELLAADPAARPEAAVLRSRLAVLAAEPEVTTVLTGLRPPLGTAVLPAHPSAPAPTVAAHVAPRRRRAMSPLVAFLVLAGGGAAVIGGVLAVTMTGGSSDATTPSAPATSGSTHAAPTRAAAPQRSSATSTAPSRATQVRTTSAPASAAQAPAGARPSAAQGPGAGPGGPAGGRPAGGGPGKAKGHDKHDK